ncbi:MAG TPA: DUF4097 family beta strand repeat-containing protein [Candidatus Sulfotelmatobacter sp.]|jgi:DUF4097 and DUF4098 domain-containing protein YvlB|nr:DUF4097 family beta strand repeat-containing protein [Candidatus Sulfotelmatobacter sp.]
MKRIGLAILVLALAAATPALADEWSKTYNLSGKPDLRVETSDANIRVSTWDQNTIEAKVTTSRYKIGEGGIRVEEHQNGDSVEIDVRYPHHNFNFEWGQHRVDIEIRMPREGKVNLRTGDGKIDIGGFKGDMDLHTGDGSETLDGVDGKLRASTGDGHITANGRFDELELKTGDGHVEVRAAAGSSLSAGWRLETGDGNVTLEVPGEIAADVDLHTNDGHIDLDMPVTTEGKIRENEVRGKINGGGSLLTIRTGDGSIHLRKS